MKYETRHAVALLSTGHGMVDFYGNFLPILLPLLMTQFGLSLTMCGVLVMVSSVTTNMRGTSARSSRGSYLPQLLPCVWWGTYRIRHFSSSLSP